MKRDYFAFLVIVLVAAIACQAEFQVNTYTDDEQVNPAIAMDSQGNFVVVWKSKVQDGGSRGVYGQRFNADGTQVGDEFKISTSSVAGFGWSPSVGMDGSGNFVVVWQGADDSSHGIYARLYSSTGEAVTDEFLVNTYTLYSQDYPHVAMNNSGSFVVVWKSDKNPGPIYADWYISGRVYNSAGTPVSPEFDVSISLHGKYPQVAMDSSGDFVVTWQREGTVDNPPYGRYIRLRRYNADSTPKADPVQVTDNLKANRKPRIGMDPMGNFIITWSWHPETYRKDDIYIQQFDPNGTPINNPFIVNSCPDGQQGAPSVAMNDNGDFVIVWYSRADNEGSEDQDGSKDGVFGQRYNSDGTAVGDEFQVNTYIVDKQYLAKVVLRNDGQFVSVWQSNGQDGSDYGILGEFGPKICCADFSGDLFVNFRDYCVLAEEWLKEGNPLKTDLIDDNRIDGLDLAAFVEQWLTPCYECEKVNIYFDGKIDFKDYALLAANWLKQGPNLDGDITGNGIVDMADLKALLFHWADYCEIPVRKPNIYLYPEETIELDVNLVFPHGGRVTTSIPKYGDGWHITVEPSGLINGEYKCLFYESLQHDYGQYAVGWVVIREELEDFFRNNMARTGFNETEIDDFINYWIRDSHLPEYPYYAIYPQYNSELEEMIKLEFSMQPQNLIRLIYSVRGLRGGNLNLQQPVIPPFAREGFTVTEWGVILK